MAADNTEQIKSLKEARDSGLRSVTTDGLTTQFASIAEMNRLIRQLERESGSSRRPTVFKMRLGGAW